MADIGDGDIIKVEGENDRLRLVICELGETLGMMELEIETLKKELSKVKEELRVKLMKDGSPPREF